MAELKAERTESLTADGLACYLVASMVDDSVALRAERSAESKVEWMEMN